MKKKWLCLLLAAVLLVTLLPALTLPALAEGKMKEEFTANGAATVQGQHITVSSDRIDGQGWYGGSDHGMTIQAKKGYMITKVEAEIGWYGGNFQNLQPILGTKVESTAENGDTVHFVGINSSEFRFHENDDPVQFKKLVVYYKENGLGKSSGTVFSEGTVAILVGIACAAVFGLGGYLMGRRQRPAKR